MKCTLSHKSTLTITWEGEPWRNVHTAIFGKKPSLPQECSSLEEFEAEFSKVEYRQAKAYALRRLAAMSMLSSGLAKSLRTRFVSADIVERIIRDFTVLGYLDDQDWVNSFIRVQTQKKVGPKAIAAKLAAKGVSNEFFEACMGDGPNEKDQRSLVRELLQTKYRKRNLGDFKERQKVVAALVRRGFDLSAVLDAVRDPLQEYI